MRIVFLFFIILINYNVYSNELNKYFFLQWDCKDVLLFEGEAFDKNTSFNSWLNFSFENNVDLKLKNEIYIDLNQCEDLYISQLDLVDSATFIFKHGLDRKHRKVNFEIFPLRKSNGKWQKLIYFEIDIIKYPLQKNTSSNTNSVLSSGDWYQISVDEDGIFEINYQDLINLGIDVNSINPNKIQLFGHPGGMLPKNVNEQRTKDLKELNIVVLGQEDNKFDTQDKVIFFGQSPHQWVFNNEENRFEHQINYYSDYTYYFLRIEHETGKRVSVFSNLTENPNYFSNSFNDFVFHESEQYNLIKSGRKWYGDKFFNNTSNSFNFNFPNNIGQINLRAAFATSVSSADNFTYLINLNGEQKILTGPNSQIGQYTFATYDECKFLFPSSSDISLDIQFLSSYSGAEAWIDFVELNSRRKLKMVDSQLLFRDTETVNDSSITEFQLEANNAINIWDVTDPLRPKEIQTNVSNLNYNFKLQTNTLKELIAFSNEYKSVKLIGSVSNQNLQSKSNIDMLIISPDEFILEANRLAEFHRNISSLKVLVVTPQQIYNEFSSGSQDVSAIRDFAKHLYESPGQSLKYLLLFGDASYDPKNRILNNTNFIPSYQSLNSNSQTASYVSDDFFAILDDGESIGTTSSSLPFLDIGVGRFPVKNINEARTVVDKIFEYYQDESKNPWRLNVCFVADDNDVLETRHVEDADELVEDFLFKNPVFNVDKIYLDSYIQESNSGGQRCESVNQAINEKINNGLFLINYTGHGGELGWAQERILGLEDIFSWNNNYKLPIFMTATCEFSRFDDPSRNSAGEEVFLKDRSGAIALFSTSRLVFTGANKDLNKSFLNNLVQDNVESENIRLGDIIRKAKNNVTNSSGNSTITDPNHRNFTLLGDPALKLSFPKYKIIISESSDTIGALGKVSMSGKVVDNKGVLLSNFNGFLNISVFDKSITKQTLGQDASIIFNYNLQNSLIFKGKASVNNGMFSFSFIVPKDINYNYGVGKASLYAKGNIEGQPLVDAAGYSFDFVIGGTSDELVEDFDGPQIRLFMNDTLFNYRDYTSDNPDLLALLYDENGLNTVGNGIGHDAVAIIDEQTSTPIILNDFYESDIDTYKSGKIRYPLTNLSEGLHTLRVKVWDINNNSSEAYTEFIVSNSNLEISNLFNYPNPVFDYTEFYFNNNIKERLDVFISISDLKGKTIANLNQSLVPDGNAYGPISLNVNNPVKLSPGIYLYNVLAISNDGHEYNNSGKLVIIR